jgi:hypothetical protein
MDGRTADLPFTSWRRVPGREVRPLLAAAMAVHRRPWPSGTLAALLAARRPRPISSWTNVLGQSLLDGPARRRTASRMQPTAGGRRRGRPPALLSLSPVLTTAVLSVLSPAAAAMPPARSGHPAAASTSSRSRWGRRQRRLRKARPPRRHCHHPDRRPVGQPRAGRHRISRRRLVRACPAEDPGDRFPGDLRAGQPLPGPRQPLFQPRSSPRSSLTSRWAAASRRCNSPVSEAIGHLLAPTRNSTRSPAVMAGQPASSQLSKSLKKSYTHPICPAGSQPHASSIAATRPDCAAVTSSS